MKKLLLVGCILLTGAAFGSDMAARMDELEAGLRAIQEQERMYYEEQREIAMNAQEELKSLKVMHAEVTAREKALGGRKGEQYRDLANQYKEMKKELEAGIKANEKVIAEFNAMNKK